MGRSSRREFLTTASTPLSFNNKSNADGYRNQQGFTPKPGNSDSTWCTSMQFLRRAGESLFLISFDDPAQCPSGPSDRQSLVDNTATMHRF
jgi:hypothetical protein